MEKVPRRHRQVEKRIAKSKIDDLYPSYKNTPTKATESKSNADHRQKSHKETTGKPP